MSEQFKPQVNIKDLANEVIENRRSIWSIEGTLTREQVRGHIKARATMAESLIKAQMQRAIELLDEGTGETEQAQLFRLIRKHTVRLERLRRAYR